MMKQIICNNLKCKHWKQSGICSCHSIVLKFSNIATVNQGRKDILECSRYEKSKEYQELENMVNKLLQNGSDDNE